jgi:hypothetical protein
VIVGRDVEVLDDGPEEVELVGKVRLRPGFVIEIVPRPRSARRLTGTALVLSWRVRVLGSNGPIYRGVCRWFPSAGGEPIESTPQMAEERAKSPTGRLARDLMNN